MRLSSDLPPSGFTRAEPRPPGHRCRFPPPRPAIAAAAVGAVLALGLGYATMPAVPARTTAPGAATPSAEPPPEPPPASTPATAPSPGRAAPGPGDAASASRPVTRTKPSRRGHAVPSRAHRPRTPRPRPATRPKATRHTRPARPAAPSWITAECRRRYPDAPRHRAACVAVLTEMFGS